jgi:hypothetical protein
MRKIGSRTVHSQLGHYISESEGSRVDPSLPESLKTSTQWMFSKNATRLFQVEERRIKEVGQCRAGFTLPLILAAPAFLPSKSEAADFLFNSDMGNDIYALISKIMVDPHDAEALALTDTSRFILDVSSFLTTEKIILRLASIISRFVNIEIGTSVTPNHLTTSPLEEVIFQAAMLGMSMTLLSKTVLPMILSSQAAGTLPFRDLVMYKSLFYPVGVSQLQFRTLLSMSVLEWIQIAPNTTLPTGLSDTPGTGSAIDQYIYWLYNGDAQVILQRSNSIVHYNLNRRRGKCIVRPNKDGARVADKLVGNVDAGTHDWSRIESITALENVELIADMNFVERLEERKSASGDASHTSKYKRITKKDHDNAESWRPMPLIQSGSTGAVLVRIDGKKLVRLMDDDDKLDLSIRTLLLQCLHSNLMTVLQMK